MVAESIAAGSCAEPRQPSDPKRCRFAVFLLSAIYVLAITLHTASRGEVSDSLARTCGMTKYLLV